MSVDPKRLFLGFDIISPWPENFPEGQKLLEKDRHVTLVFIGKEDSSSWVSSLEKMPFFSDQSGIGGIFDEQVFLPMRQPRAAAWHIHWMDGGVLFGALRQRVIEWAASEHLEIKQSDKPFCPHVTMARRPFSIASWKQTFSKRPMYLGSLHLYESLGACRYDKLWSRSIPSPFVEIEHTADLAFSVGGRTLQEIFLNAQLALCFHFPPLVEYLIFDEVLSLDEIVQMLNRLIARADLEKGCPFKAVSYHGVLIQKDLMEWEMIVDV